MPAPHAEAVSRGHGIVRAVRPGRLGRQRLPVETCLSSSAQPTTTTSWSRIDATSKLAQPPFTVVGVVPSATSSRAD